MTREIPLSRGKVALVDDEDYGLVAQYKWSATCPARHSWYATRTDYSAKPFRSIYMHRYILNAPPELDVDHINGDGLDNRRANIRVCTTSQNAANNRRAIPITNHGFKGITRVGTRWVAHIKCGGHELYIGRFDDPESAARAYDSSARKYFGEFARLNFPNQEEDAAQ